MPVTRSASKPAAAITKKKPDTGDASQQKSVAKKPNRESKSTKGASQAKSVAIPNTSKKRVASKDDDTSEKSNKKVKAAKQEDTEQNDSVKINRSPVLQLWASTVAAFTHPDESWETCLSIGSAISTLCAISKGKAIGQIEPKDKSPEEQEKKKKRNKDSKKDSYEVEVMGFSLHVKDGAAILDGKPKNANEKLLKGKYGDEATYENVKKVMQDALESWQSDKDELNRRAFHMYEDFRPTVPAGQSGWGRKGELKFEEVKNIIEK